MTELSKIAIPLQPGLKEPYVSLANANLFAGDNLILPILPKDYRILAPKKFRVPIEGIESTIVEVVSQAYAFECTVRDGREAVGKILHLLILAAEADPYSYQPIVLHDYVLPDESESEYSEYSVRQGVLQYEILSGNFQSREHGNYYTEGYKLVFSEII